jgi:hypothetical protein
MAIHQVVRRFGSLCGKSGLNHRYKFQIIGHHIGVLNVRTFWFPESDFRILATYEAFKCQANQSGSRSSCELEFDAIGTKWINFKYNVIKCLLFLFLPFHLLRFTNYHMGNYCTQQGFQNCVRRKSWVLSVLVLLFLQVSVTTFGQGSGTNILTYAGGSGNERFQGVLQLSDGTLLIGGQADNFSWLPAGTTVNLIPNSGNFRSVSNQGSGFIMHLSADQQVVLSVLRFPDNTVRDVFKIKTNSLPGQPTGDIFISGSRDAAAAEDGYYIARLNNNFLNGQPTGLAYYKSVEARTRNGGSPSIQFPAGIESAHKQYQIWDVNAKGQILYATGNDFSFDKVTIGFMNRNGVDTLMNYFNIHNPGFTGVPSSSFVNSTGNPAFDLQSSILSFRYSSTDVPGAMRSYSNSLFNQVSRDENGNIGRKGAFPLDAFFDSPQYLGGASATTNGPGYTGYSVGTGGGKWTGKIGGIVFDKRNGHFYIGFSISVTSVSNQTGLDDTEPALAACNENGELKWWARLHKEDGARSSAQQQVEGIDFDYSRNHVVVLGRTRGNSQNNFWKGNELKANKTGNGFQNHLIGSRIRSCNTGLLLDWKVRCRFWYYPQEHLCRRTSRKSDVSDSFFRSKSGWFS